MQLTLTERTVLAKLCEDKTHQEIADELFMSKRNVERVVEVLKDKFDCKKIAGLISKYKDIQNKAA
jgi:DNA-binding CsgD family transcriptional regulator